jgi:hypothetical protein
VFPGEDAKEEVSRNKNYSGEDEQKKINDEEKILIKIHFLGNGTV